MKIYRIPAHGKMPAIRITEAEYQGCKKFRELTSSERAFKNNAELFTEAFGNELTPFIEALLVIWKFMPEFAMLQIIAIIARCKEDAIMQEDVITISN